MSSIFSTLNINLSSLPNIAECLTDSSVQRFKFNLAGLLALLTDSVHRNSDSNADIADAKLLDLYTAAAQQYGELMVLNQTESRERRLADPEYIINQLIAEEDRKYGKPAREFTEKPLPPLIVCTVNDIIAELLQANEPLLRSLYALSEPRDLAAELYAYFYQNAAKADLCCFPAQRCSGLLGAWLAAQPDGSAITAGNFLLLGQPSFMLTFELPGTCFINDFIKDYVMLGIPADNFIKARSWGDYYAAEDFVESALLELCPGLGVYIFSLFKDEDDGYGGLFDTRNVLPYLKHPNFQYFDAAFVLPLYGRVSNFYSYHVPDEIRIADERYTELVMTEQALRCTHGRVISQVLVSELSGSAVQFKKFRQQLCADRRLKAVCQLPKNFYQPDIEPSALLFMTTSDADLSDDVTFIDLSGFDLKKNPKDWEEVLQILSSALNGKPTSCSAAVSYSDIKALGNILLPSIYCSDSSRLFYAAMQTNGSCPLSDVAEIIRCQTVTAEGAAPMYEVQMSSIDQLGFIDPAKVSKAINCRPDDPQMLKQRLQENDIIMVIKGPGIGTAAIAHHAGDNWLCSQYFAIIRRRPDAPLSVEELFFALRSDAVQAFAKTHAKGAKLPLLSIKTLSTLPLIAAAADKDDAKANFIRLCKLRAEIQQLTAKALSLSFSQVLPSSAEEDCASA